MILLLPRLFPKDLSNHPTDLHLEGCGQQKKEEADILNFNNLCFDDTLHHISVFHFEIKELSIFFRPPYGKKLLVLPYYLSQIGMTTIMWSIEPETDLGYDASPDDIAQYVIDNVENGSIILFHPMYNAENVLAALNIIVSELQKQRYMFCTVSDIYDEYS